jgi:succinate dehydrogenase/fumarate reductase flavoprotein subunit
VTTETFDQVVDVVVVGSGAGGLAAAVTAGAKSLEVLVLEKDSLYGGTTARSGGVVWTPCNPMSQALGIADSVQDARTYLMGESGAAFNAEKVDAFLNNGPRMVEFFQRETSLQFVPVPEFSDYHPDRPGGRPGGRSILAAPFDGRLLGEKLKQLRPPLKEITFVGMMFNASEEVQHFFNATRSLRSALYVVKRLASHGIEMITHGRATRLTNGNALVARLAKSAFDLGIPIWLNSPVVRLISDAGRVTGVVVKSGDGVRRVGARLGVVLAAGGFPQDVERRKRLFPHAPTGREHLSPAPASNTGDGLCLAESVAGHIVEDLPHAAAWIPVSQVRWPNGELGTFPHLIDRYKPGVICVTREGKRFVNESDSYHDVGAAMQTANAGRDAVTFLICDHRALRRYGLGFVKPFPLPLYPHLKSQYLYRGKTVGELARVAGISVDGLESTIEIFNRDARNGKDPQFGRGTTAYNRFLGDKNHKPNPCVAPIAQGPFYAIKAGIGDLGTFDGINTDQHARALNRTGDPIAGLFAVGNDAVSIMGGSYPGGGITLGPALTFGYIAGEYLASAGSR